MEFKANGKKLAKALELANAAVDPKANPSQVYEQVRLTAGAGKLGFAMTDGVVTAQYEMEAEVKGEGTCLVDGDKFSAIAKSWRAHDIVFVQKGQERSKITNTGDAGEFRLPYMNPDLFPRLPGKVAGDVTLSVPVFNYLLGRTMFCAMPTTRHGVLTDAVRFEVIGGRLTAVATDGYRVAVASAPWEGLFPDMTVPKRACMSLFALTREIIEPKPDEEGATETVDIPTLSVDSGESDLWFRFGDLYVNSVKHGKSFFPWRDLMGRRNETFADVDVEPDKLKRAVSDIVIVKGEAVVVTVEGRMCRLREFTKVGAEGRNQIACSDAGRRLETALNAKHLLEYLEGIVKAKAGGLLTVSMGPDAGEPVFFEYRAGDRKSEYVSMPVDLNQ